MNFKVYVTETVRTSKTLKWSWNWLNTKNSYLNENIYWVILTCSLSGALYWMKQLFIIKQTPSGKDVFFLMSISRLYPGLKLSSENNSVRKNLFVCACFCWDSRPSLREMDKKFMFVGNIGYGDSYLEFLFRHFKVFRLHAKLHDAAGAMRAHSGKGPGYCYMIGRGPNSCLLGHVTGLVFCLYVNFFLPSIFKSFDFWSSMSCIVLDFELTYKNVIRELGFLIDFIVQGYPFCPPKKYKRTKQAFWCTRNLHGILWNSGGLAYSELSNILPLAGNGEWNSWACLGQTCSRSLIVFLSQLFVILLINFGCFWKIYVLENCDESTVWVGFLCSSAGYILPSPRLWTS